MGANCNIKKGSFTEKGHLGKDLKEGSQAELCGKGIPGRGHNQGKTQGWSMSKDKQGAREPAVEKARSRVWKMGQWGQIPGALQASARTLSPMH